jgi:hypothetical protein
MEHILYFGNQWNAENKTSSHHIAERLSRTHKVIYIECPGMRSPRLGSGRDWKKIFEKITNSLRPPKKINDNFYVYTLFQLPFHGFPLIRAINKWLVVGIVRILMMLYNIKKPSLWFLIPHLYMLPGKVPARSTIYYVTDDHSALPDVDINAIELMDKQMTENVDMVFVASGTLYEKKKLLNKNVFISPHGVEFDHFNRVYQKTAITPEDAKHLPHPLIGFWGLIEEWIDLDLIHHIATQRPEWHFLMIGRLAVEKNPCENLPNVHFIGKRSFAELPHYASVFDVAILPYRNNRQVINSNPLKLREYLATGVATVSLKIPQTEQYAHVVELALTYDEFIAAIEMALRKNTAEDQLKRIESVKDATWDNRVNIIQQTINDTLNPG